MVILSILRTVGIYLGLVQADTGDLCVACAYDLAHKGSMLCGGCDEQQGEYNCYDCRKSTNGVMTAESVGFGEAMCYDCYKKYSHLPDTYWNTIKC